MNPNDPETLEQRSDSIRADVGETLDALQRNYSPGALVDRSMDLLRDHGGEMATNIMQTVRRNPMPALLVLAGVTWMIASQLRSSRDDDGYGIRDDDDGRSRRSRFGGGTARYDEDDLSLDTGYTYGGSAAEGGDIGGTPYTPGSFNEDGSDADNGGATADSGSGGGRLAGAREKLRSATHAASDSVSGGARRLKEQSRHVAERAREQSRRAGEGMTRLLQEQPFAVGAAGIVIGAVIGAILPETAQENRLLGPARDRALDKARAAGEQGYETARQKVHDVVEKTGDKVRDTVRDDGERGSSAAGGTAPVI
jgi:ElaB/YqjD/DUF883 family membrane-anchored ribosome-binding protein